MKKLTTFIVLAVFASAVLIGCSKSEGDPSASGAVSGTDSSAGSMESKPGDSSVTPETSTSTPATTDAAPGGSTSTPATSGGN